MQFPVMGNFWLESACRPSRHNMEQTKYINPPGPILFQIGQEGIKLGKCSNQKTRVPIRISFIENWTENELLSLITRDTMVGVSIPKVN